MTVKICPKCKENKNLTDFYKNKDRKDGLRWECKNCSKVQNKKFRENNLNYKPNKKQTSEYFKEYHKKRRLEDLNYKLAWNLRTRLRTAIKQNNKSGSAIKDLGCSIEFFKSYFEFLFQQGMTWDNYGKWHIDHIIPLSWFDLSNREEFLKAVHYSNLQPLWAKDNIKKSDS